MFYGFLCFVFFSRNLNSDRRESYNLGREIDEAANFFDRNLTIYDSMYAKCRLPGKSDNRSRNAQRSEILSLIV